MMLQKENMNRHPFFRMQSLTIHKALDEKNASFRCCGWNESRLLAFILEILSGGKEMQPFVWKKWEYRNRWVNKKSTAGGE